MNLVNLERVVLSPRFAQTVTVRRTTGEYNDYGEWESNAPSEFSATGSFQRVTEKELALLGFGEVKQEVRKLLTPTEIKVSEDDDKLSDRLIWSGKRYKVLKVTDDVDYGFYRAIGSYEGDE